MRTNTIDTQHFLRAALVTALVATTVASQAASPSSTGTGKRPNIVIILGDDLGFSDMGCFDAGLTALEAAKRIEFGPYGEWRAPARLYMNVERAYREVRSQPADAPWDTAATFDAIYQVAKAKGIAVEF
jgi:hypothetical protein